VSARARRRAAQLRDARAPSHSLTRPRSRATRVLTTAPSPLSPQFFWNYSLPETKTYYRDSVLASIAYPEVDGTFTDDVSGIPDEHGNLPARLGLSAADVDFYRHETSVANAMLIDAAIAQGKYVWAAFGAQDGVAAGPTRATCAAWMRARCTPDWQARATTQALDAANFNQSLAAFLVVRPPIGFLGYGCVLMRRGAAPPPRPRPQILTTQPRPPKTKGGKATCATGAPSSCGRSARRRPPARSAPRRPPASSRGRGRTAPRASTATRGRRRCPRREREGGASAG
jgi:hypothetical protein